MANTTADQVAGYYNTYLGRTAGAEETRSYLGTTATEAENIIRNSDEARNRLASGQMPNTVENTMSGQVNAPSLPAGTQVIPQLQSVGQDEVQKAPTATGGTDQKATAADISAMYQKYLGRTPDAQGLADQTAAGHTIAQLEASFKNSAEYQQRVASGVAPVTGSITDPTAKAATSATATAPGVQAASTYEASTIGTNTPTMQGATTGGKVPNADQISALYKAYLGRAPDAAGLQAHIDAAQKGGQTLDQIEASIKNSAEAKGALAAGYTPDQAAIQKAKLGGSAVDAAQGSLSPAATAVAQTGTAAQVQSTAPRTVKDGEMVSGSAVDQSKVAGTDAVAAQGTVDRQSTVQGQLEGLMNQFEGGQTPAWAAGAMRKAEQALAARGVSASSMAGQAIVQAAMEAAAPIAAADAQTYAAMGLANLSARQQTALQNAQQRAQFLGKEFDQNFQARVLNAAKISEIANLNFTAEQTVALENAKLTQQMNLQNLSNAQATAIANAATLASMDMANLNNRQAAAVANAQAFLQTDLANLSNMQQAAVINQQSRVQTLMSDQAAQNVAKQANATSENQVRQFYDGLAEQVSRFNAGQKNAVELANSSEANAMSKFVAEQKEAREKFNIQNQMVVDQSNVNWRRTVNTQNTAAINATNQVNAQNLLNLSNTALNNIWQQFRDEASWAFTAGENQANRNYNLAAAAMERDFLTNQMDENQKNTLMQQLGNFGANLVGRAFNV